MTEEVKKLIESVKRYGTRQITTYSLERAKAGLTENRFVRESDFDRVVEELTKQIYLSDEKALRFAEWNKNNGYLFNRFSGKWYKNMLDDDCFTTEEIYTSKAFEDYLNGLKK